MYNTDYKNATIKNAKVNVLAGIVELDVEVIEDDDSVVFHSGFMLEDFGKMLHHIENEKSIPMLFLGEQIPLIFDKVSAETLKMSIN
jgi:hypothetical protein